MTIKRTTSKVNGKRTFNLFKAKELVDKDAAANGKKADINMKERTLKIDAQVVFNQGKEDVGGTFSGKFAHLALP